jgi:hypothetical protein
MRRVGVVSGAFIGAVAVCAAISGCSFSFHTGGGAPVVAKADLQKDITDRLKQAGETPQSVTCSEDLVGEVDKSTRCEVVLSETNAIEPIVKVTKVEGQTVNYNMTPALSKEQLQNQVANLLNTDSADTISCEGGLEGVVGNETSCTVKGSGGTSETVVTVTEVNGLLMNIRIPPRVDKADLEQDITGRLTSAGQPPQSVSCNEDLLGVVGTTTRCEVVLGEHNAIEPIVKVTKVEGTTVSYDMTPALSEPQLEVQVATLMAGNAMPADTVSCEGGLEGVVGNKVNCTVEGGGETTETVVTVTESRGLLMNFTINPA